MFGVQGVYPLGKVLLESAQKDFFMEGNIGQRGEK